ncbi:MAG: DUF362 domain-containing protein [Proteobacteria bacterium]|nr:DUF362 domain-containing protein [Pseudomonadota bacterium]
MGYKTKVAIVRPSEYENIEMAVSYALGLINAGNILERHDKVLIKPNLLMNRKGAYTEADFIKAVGLFFKKHNSNLSIGDSPGQFRASARDVIEAMGVDSFLEEENIAYAEFEGGLAVQVNNPDALHMKRYHIAQPVDEADVVINVPRPKSHIEASYTGAVKNYWGIIPGGAKAQCHLYGGNAQSFGNVIVDNYLTLVNAKKKLITIMDGREFMEGMGGPATGPMRNTDVIVAGFDDVAVDVVMLAIGGLDAVTCVGHLKACQERGLGVTDLNDIEIIGKSIEETRQKKKIKIPGSGLSRFVSLFTSKFIYKMIREMPGLDEKECTKCGDCSELCPVKAIDWEKNQHPSLQDQKCISCLCCIECCPEQALSVKRAGLRGLTWKSHKKANLPS